MSGLGSITLRVAVLTIASLGAAGCGGSDNSTLEGDEGGPGAGGSSTGQGGSNMGAGGTTTGGHGGSTGGTSGSSGHGGVGGGAAHGGSSGSAGHGGNTGPGGAGGTHGGMGGMAGTGQGGSAGTAQGGTGQGGGAGTGEGGSAGTGAGGSSGSSAGGSAGTGTGGSAGTGAGGSAGTGVGGSAGTGTGGSAGSGAGGSAGIGAGGSAGTGVGGSAGAGAGGSAGTGAGGSAGAGAGGSTGGSAGAGAGGSAGAGAGGSAGTGGSAGAGTGGSAGTGAGGSAGTGAGGSAGTGAGGSAGTGAGGSAGTSAGGSAGTGGAGGSGGSCTADGPHVSQDTCDPTEECGTVDKPWCKIQSGINNSATFPVVVAKSTTAYDENVVMKDGVDVEGGWDTPFAARDPNPSTNGTTIDVSAAVGVTWPAGATALLDGFTIQVSGNASGDRSGATIGTGANAHFTGVDIVPGSGLPGAIPNASGIHVLGAGSLTVDGSSSILAPKATTISGGVVVDTQATAAVSLVGAQIFGGPAGSSFGVRDLGVGQLDVSGGTYSGGTSTVQSVGISATGTSGAGLNIQGASITGGISPLAIGIDAANVTTVVIGGKASSTGGGSKSGSTSAFGARVNGVTTLSVDTASLVGANVVGATANTGTGLLIQGKPATTITNLAAQGGSLAAVCVGVDVQGGTIDLSSSALDGSTTAASGSRNIGVRVGALVSSAKIHDNARIVGGAPTTGDSGPYLAAGIALGTTSATTIADNTLIRGCSTACSGKGTSDQFPAVAAGVQITAGALHTIDGNVEIRGGGHANPAGNPPDKFVVHAGVLAVSSAINPGTTPLGLTLSNNTLVVGHTDPANRADRAYGVVAGGASLNVSNNKSIFGGRAITFAGGIVLLDSAIANSASVSGSNIAGGVAVIGTGLELHRSVKESVTDNVIDGCGVDDTLTNECSTVTTSTGFLTSNAASSFVANNFVFGGFGLSTVACSIGNDGTTGSVSFDLNLCLAQGRAANTPQGNAAVGLVLQGAQNKPPVGLSIIDNLLSAGSDAATRFVVEETPAAVKAATFKNNDVLPDADVAKAGIAFYLRAPNIEIDTTAGIDALSAGTLDYEATVSLDPAFVDATKPHAPTTANYRLDVNTCNVEDLGIALAAEPLDYFGVTRGTTTTDIGPSVCK